LRTIRRCSTMMNGLAGLNFVSINARDHEMRKRSENWMKKISIHFRKEGIRSQRRTERTQRRN
jgi:hypothetical protein